MEGNAKVVGVKLDGEGGGPIAVLSSLQPNFLVSIHFIIDCWPIRSLNSDAFTILNWSEYYLQ